MHFELTEEQRAIASLARDFAEKRLAAVQEADEPKHLFRREVVSEMGKLGLLATLLPEEYGGTNMGFMSTVLIIEEMARVCVSYCLFPMSQVAGPGLTILKYGTSEQKARYLAGLASGDILSCFGATEPDSGSGTKR